MLESILAIGMLVLGVLIERYVPLALKRLREKRWKTYVLQEQPNRELITKLRPESKVDILGRKHTVKGFVVYSHGGERTYEFTLQVGPWERWLEFDGDDIKLWGAWSDAALWGETERRDEPESIRMKQISDAKSLELEVGGVGLEVKQEGKSSKYRLLWGTWGRDTAGRSSVMHYVEAGVMKNGRQALVNGRKQLVCLTAYGNQSIYESRYHLVGLELERRGIRIVD